MPRFSSPRFPISVDLHLHTPAPGGRLRRMRYKIGGTGKLLFPGAYPEVSQAAAQIPLDHHFRRPVGDMLALLAQSQAMLIANPPLALRYPRDRRLSA